MRRMEQWQEVLAATMGALVTLGGGLRWLISWLFKELRSMQQNYLDALEAERAMFEKHLLELRSDVASEREKRLQDKDEYAKTLLELTRALTTHQQSTSR